MTGHRTKLGWWVRGLMLLLVGTLAVFIAMGWRWLTLPAPDDVIDARWQDVEGWAEPLGPDADDELLVLACDAMAAEALELPEGDAPRVDAAPAAVDEAIGRLIAWHRQEGGLQRCNWDVDLRSYRLGQWALATATADEVEQAAAVARLAKLLRQNGNSLQAAIGVVLSRNVIEWTADRGVRDAAFVLELQPHSEEAFHAYARDAVCAVESPDLADELDDEVEAPLLASVSPLDREYDMLRWYFGDLLTRAHPLRGDLAAFSELLATETESVRTDPPPSYFVRAMAFAPSMNGWKRFEQTWADRSSGG